MASHVPPARPGIHLLAHLPYPSAPAGFPARTGIHPHPHLSSPFAPLPVYCVIPPLLDRHAWRSDRTDVTGPCQAPAYFPHVLTIRSTVRTHRHASWRGAFHGDVAALTATSVFSPCVAFPLRSVRRGRAATLFHSTATRARVAYPLQFRTPRGVRRSPAWRTQVVTGSPAATRALGVAPRTATSWGVAVLPLRYATRGVRRPLLLVRRATWLPRSLRVAYRSFP